MKKLGSKKHVSDRVYKYLIQLLWSDFFGSFLMNKRNELAQIDPSKMSTFNIKIKNEIQSFLKARKIPTHWGEPLFDIVVKGKINLPLHEGISLSVGNYQIRQNGYDFEEIKSNYNFPLSINLTSDASLTQLKDFINDNAGMIKKLQELLNLPEVKYPRLDNLVEGFHINMMRENQKMTYGQIVKELMKDPHYSKDDPEDLRNKVKNVAKKYKEYLKQRS